MAESLLSRMRNYVKEHPYKTGAGASLLTAALALALKKKFKGASLVGAGGAAAGSSGSWLSSLPDMSADLTGKAADLPFWMAESMIGNALDQQTDIVKSEAARKLGGWNAGIQRGAVEKVLRGQGVPESQINQRLQSMMSHQPTNPRLRQNYEKRDIMRVARKIASERSMGRHFSPDAIQRKFQDAGIYIGDDMAGQLVSQAGMANLVDPMRKF